MKWWLVALITLIWVGGCKRKEVPFVPPSPQDGGATRRDAEAAVDAPRAHDAAQATKIVVGEQFSCALLMDATLRCWGRNREGQIGNGTTADAPAPSTVPLTGVKDVVLGTAHVCALLDDESVTCWGRIHFGKTEDLLAPTAVAGVAKAKQLFAVSGASCATIDDDSLVCWGDIDVKGHLRLAGGSMHRVATPANGLDHVVAMTASGALKADGTVWFWGNDGQPVKTALTDVIEIAATGGEVCGLRRDGSVACAGPATRCVAAAPKAAPTKAPSKPAPKRKAKQSPPKRTVKGTKQPAKPAAKPAPPTPEASGLPIEVLRLPPAKHLAFDVGLCVVTRGGKLQCLAAKNGCEVEPPWSGLANVDYVIGTCARLGDGNARCWSAAKTPRAATAVAGLRGAIAVAASSSHACAILDDRSVVCWGGNKSGALGRSEATEHASREPRAVTF